MLNMSAKSISESDIEGTFVTLKWLKLDYEYTLIKFVGIQNHKTVLLSRSNSVHTSYFRVLF